MSTGDQYPPSPEQQPQYPPNPYQQQPQYPQQQPQYPTNPYQQPPQYPYPGQPTQGQPYPSQPMYGAPPAGQGGNSNRRLFIIIGSIVGVVVLACCALFGFAALANRAANSNLGSQSQSTATVSATATTGSSTTSSNQHHKVGDTVAASDAFTVTVNSVKTSTGDDFFKPDAGNTFVVVDVTIKNTSSKEQEVSSLLQFSLKDSTGQQYSETITTEGTPPDGKIEAGDQLKGQITYEVPKSQHDFALAFEADILSEGQTIWDLHV